MKISEEYKKKVRSQFKDWKWVYTHKNNNLAYWHPPLSKACAYFFNNLDNIEKTPENLIMFLMLADEKDYV